MLASIVRIFLGSTVSAGIHVYLWLRLVRPAHLPRRWHLAATIALVVMFLSIPVTTAGRMYAPGLSASLGWLALPWMALAGLMFVTLVAIDLVAGDRVARPRRVTPRAGRPGAVAPAVPDARHRRRRARGRR